MTERKFPDYVAQNQKAWTKNAPRYAEGAREKWLGEPSWGIWDIPDTELGLLNDVNGREALEVGCGTGYVSAWIAGAGGRVVGIDPTAAQLETAASLQHELDVRFPLVGAIGEMLPFKDESFDLVISEYGAAIWADPYAWIPEAARVLRLGGELIFMGNASLLMLCVQELEEDDPATDRLLRPYFGMYRFEWPDSEEVEFHIGHGDWIRVLRSNGFEIEDLIELQAPPDATSRYPFVTAEWARKWPSEEIWRVRKTTAPGRQAQ